MSHDTASMAVIYTQRGWAVTPLHDVSGDSCSCGSAEPRHAREGGGKHPLLERWQARPLTNELAVREAWARRPMANVGILTGPASGVWVLDVDPEHGGDAALRQLIERHGPLPDTYTVRTGSGGVHYYWSMPEWDLTNSRGRLPDGIDVRGRGGFVVAPPSISGKGPYLVPEGVTATVAAAPAWLLDLVRPRPAPIAQVAPMQAQPYAYAAMPNGRDRGVMYAREGVGRELYELQSAPPGQRNQTGFSVACRLVELLNAPWSGLQLDEVRQAFLSAASAANVDGSFGYVEHEDLWRKAARTVGLKAAELPPADWLGEIVPWGLPRDAVDFSAGPSGPTGSTVPSPTPTVMFVDPFADPGESHGQALSSTPAAPAPVAYPPLAPTDPFEFAVQKSMLRIVAEREAKRRIKALDPVTPFEFLSDDQLDLIPPPEPLIEGWLYRDSLARLWGPSGAGKSHVAVDFAASIATGTPWHGCAVKQGVVVYVVAEGASGMGQRRRAWQEHHGVARTGVRWVTMPVQVMGPDWARFVAEVVALGPALVILDTQARVTEGIDENDNTAMGEVVGALERLREATKACVLLVHHQGTGDADRARGASAVKGAMATEVSVSKRLGSAEVTVRNVKQKDAAEADPMVLTLVPVGDSVALRGARDDVDPDDPFSDPTGAHGIPLDDQRALAMAQVMIDMFGQGNGGTKAEVIAAWVARRQQQHDPQAPTSLRVTGYGVWSRLEGLGRIMANPEPGMSSKRKYVVMPDAGLLDVNPDKMTDTGWNVVTPKDASRAGKSSDGKSVIPTSVTRRRKIITMNDSDESLQK